MINPDATIFCDEQRLRPGNSEFERLLGCKAKIKELADWEPSFTLDSGLSETIDWIKANGDVYKADIYNT
jgi:nucleoside-diphosphate-sugar epimerase